MEICFQKCFEGRQPEAHLQMLDQFSMLILAIQATSRLVVSLLLTWVIIYTNWEKGARKKSVFSATQFPIEQYFHKHSSLKNTSENMLGSLDDHLFDTSILGNTNGFWLSTTKAFVWKFESTRWNGHWDDPAKWLVATTHIWPMTFLTWSLILGASSHNSGTTSGHYLM
jgi:hypothetical protein